MKIHRPPQGFTLIELLVVISIIAILASLAMPAFTKTMSTAKQTTVVNNLHQIALGLHMWADDHDGMYPYADNQAAVTAASTAVPPNSTTANGALANLIPNYIPNEKIFWIAKSGWCNRLNPDEKFGSQGPTADTLSGGENHYAYVVGLSTSSSPNWPLAAEGFAAGSEGAPHYANDETAPGGLWKGKSAVVLYADCSVRKEQLDPTDQTVKGNTGGVAKTNIFVYTPGDPNWLSTTTTVVNPVKPTAP